MIPREVRIYLRLTVAAAIAVSFLLAYQSEIDAIGSSLRAQPEPKPRCIRENVRIVDGWMFIECQVAAR